VNDLQTKHLVLRKTNKKKQQDTICIWFSRKEELMRPYNTYKIDKSRGCLGRKMEAFSPKQRILQLVKNKNVEGMVP
jgi:hypothetical protein